MSDELIKVLGLSPHPYHKAGYFKEVYRSCLNVKPLSDDRQERTAGTCIQLLMKSDDFDPWHRIISDETFLYHKGSHLKIYSIDIKGKLETRLLGDTTQDNCAFYSMVIPSGTWFAAELANQRHDSYGLFSVFVCPGFNFNDSEIANPESLSKVFPNHSEIIHRLCLRK